MMKRSDFLRSIFGITTLITVPLQLRTQSNDIVYSFNELFHFPYSNDRLIYMNSNTDIYKVIKESVGVDRILESKHFKYYLGVYDVVLPIKENYTISDFNPFILCLKSYYKKDETFAEYDQGVFFRMISSGGGLMHFDLFIGGDNLMHFNTF